MKKVVKILLPFLLATSTIFCGCKKKETEDNKVLLSFGDVNSTGTTDISLAGLATRTDDKESFLLVVSTNSCGCWDKFEPNLEKYLQVNKAICYRIDYNQIKDIAADIYHIYSLSSSTTTFAIFENGAVKKTISTSKESEIMYDENRFFKFMNENVRLPSCYFITKDNYETIKSSGKNAVVYFERSECGDCKNVNPTLLYSYFKNHTNTNKIYVLDCQPYWKAKSDTDYQQYVDAKKQLGLASETNPLYGYEEGVFPFFSYIENCAYASGAVIYNQKVTEQDGKYFVSESYYSQERVASLQYTDSVLTGKELTANDVSVSGTRVSWNLESANKAYEPYLNSFLDYALPKVTFNF